MSTNVAGTPKTSRPGMPYAGSAIAVFLTKHIEALAAYKTQRQIASEIGYDKPNLISMFKRGETKVPLDKVPALAKALDVDAAHLFRLAIEQYWPDHIDVIQSLFGNPFSMSENEKEIIIFIREITSDDPALNVDRKLALKATFSS